MASSPNLPDFVAHCVELLAPLGAVRVNRMFGGHGLYVDEIFIAIVARERLYLKAAPAVREQFAAAGCEPFQYSRDGQLTALSYWSAPADAMDSPALMLPWARLALQAALDARAAKLKPRAANKARPAARPTKPASRASRRPRG